jgi:hypothetical protein
MRAIFFVFYDWIVVDFFFTLSHLLMFFFQRLRFRLNYKIHSQMRKVANFFVQKLKRKKNYKLMLVFFFITSKNVIYHYLRPF